jgi:hypothetical protein
MIHYSWSQWGRGGGPHPDDLLKVVICAKAARTSASVKTTGTRAGRHFALHG